MAAPTLRQAAQVKGKLSATLKNWLPILQSNILLVDALDMRKQLNIASSSERKRNYAISAS